MAQIIPVPTRRSTDLLMQQRLLAQLQFDQADLLRLQDMLATGQAFSRPSEDPAAALRGVAMQRLLEQKAQVRKNLDAGQSFLSAAENAGASVSQLITDIRGEAVAAANGTTSDAQREAAAQNVRQAIQQLLQVANRKFRGRYLFGGSVTARPPFRQDGRHVVFEGDAARFPTYGDVNVLFDTNVPADALFGAVSAEVRGTVPLKPVLTETTRLADLRGGLGVTPGSVVVSDGTHSSTVDLTGAETIGDVVRRLEANPPQGRTVAVRLKADRLEVRLDEAGGGNLTISEAGVGRTAAELGLLNTVGVGTGPLLGQPLAPRLTPTTRLADVLGVRAQAVLRSPGPDNDIVLEARRRGPEENGVRIQLVDDSRLQAAAGLTAGNEVADYSETAVAARAALTLSGAHNNLILTATTPGAAMNNVRIELADAGLIGNAATASFDPVARRLTLGIDSSGATTVQALVDAINAQGDFTAAYDDSDPADGGYVPGSPVSPADIGVVWGDTGNSGGDPRTIFVRIDVGATTANHVVAALQANAEIAERFDIRLDEKDITTPTAAGGGLVDVAATAVLEGGEGVEFDQESGLRIRNGGETYVVDFTGAETVEDVLNRLAAAGAGLWAEINDAGTGINIRTRLSGADFSIGENGGQTASQLGVRSFTRETPLGELNYGRGVEAAAGADFTIRRSDGVELQIDVSGAATIGDVLDLINGHPDNQNPATRVEADLASVGNGIELRGQPGPNPLTVVRARTSRAAWDLGLVEEGAEEETAVGQVLTGRDVRPLETRGVFTSLLRLQTALENGDLEQIGRAASLLDEDLDRVSGARAELGAQLQGLDSLRQRVEDEQVELHSLLSEEVDADVVQVVSDLMARQAALEAALRLVGRSLQLTLIQFI